MRTEISLANIEEYRGELLLMPGDLKCTIWDVFDDAEQGCNSAIVPLDLIISTKNQLLDEKFLSGQKKDPRQTAFNYMLAATEGKEEKRAPLTVRLENDHYYVIDGNATVQVLMLLKWDSVPVNIIRDS